MTRQDARNKLSKYPNGGNAFLVLDYLIDLGEKEINISQEYLAAILNRTRPAVQSSLELLKKIGAIEYSYGKIKIVGVKL